jgi:hypothetical protein
VKPVEVKEEQLIGPKEAEPIEYKEVKPKKKKQNDNWPQDEEITPDEQ